MIIGDAPSKPDPLSKLPIVDDPHAAVATRLSQEAIHTGLGALSSPALNRDICPDMTENNSCAKPFSGIQWKFAQQGMADDRVPCGPD